MSTQPIVMRGNLRPLAPVREPSIPLVPADWVATPELLRLMLGAIWILSAFFLLTALWGIERHRHAMQTLGHDSAPSIIAAQHIRTSLADTHRLLAESWLKSGPAALDAEAAFDARRDDVAAQIVTAAENITYGDAERKPIRALITGLGKYDALAARARVLWTCNADFEKPFHAADQVMHDELLPAANELDKANLDAMKVGYTQEQLSANWSTFGAIAIASLLLATMIGAQWFIYQRTHRVFNPFLVAGTAAVVCLLFHLINGFQDERNELRVAKVDCFDSLYALWHARACAYDANAALLCEKVDPRLGNSLFTEERERLLSVPDSLTLADVRQFVGGNAPPDQRVQGYLADELRNVSFDGESAAASETVQKFIDYVQAAEHTGDAAGMSAAQDRFAQFDSALGKTLEINQNAFDTAVPAGLDAVSSLPAESVVIMVIAGVCVYAGLRVRLREYDPH